MIRHLSAHAEIYLFALNDAEVDEKVLNKLRPWCRAIQTVPISRAESIASLLTSGTNRNLPFQLAWFRSKKAEAALRAFAGQHQPDAMYCHLIRMAPYAEIPELRFRLIDYMDSFSTGMERLAESGAYWVRLPAREEAYRLRRYENRSFAKFDRHIIISEQDQNRFPHADKKKIEIIVNGVDFDYYRVIEKPKKYDLLFLGHMSYPPNIDAACYCAERIMPLLRPEIRLLIAGAEPSARVRKLKSTTIEVSGWVDDTVQVMAESRILVAPMQLSIGLQNKILQAMACGIPCVVSHLANNAVGAVEGQSILCASDPEAYAAAIHRLLGDQTFYQSIREEGLKFVRSRFNWEQQAIQVMQLMRNTTS